jgi:aldose 1-epimerase
MKAYPIICSFLFLCLLGVNFSCTPSELGKKSMNKLKSGGEFLTEKSKVAYQSGKDALGLNEEAPPTTSKPMTISKRVFGKLADGSKVHEFRLINEQGMEVSIIEYGAAIRDIIVPDRDGKKGNVSLGFNNLQDYVEKSPYFGCIAGRYANRIAQGKFSLDGQDYQLATNNGPNHLHGGDRGFDKKVWRGLVLPDSLGVRFNLESPDGEEGYPGLMRVQATYELTENNQLKILIEATSDRPTVVNLTNHAYFNLSGEGSPSILDHLLTLPGTRFVETDSTNIPTGISSVVGTPFDFRHPIAIGRRIEDKHPQLIAGKGYDHTWLVPSGAPSDLVPEWEKPLNLGAVVRDPVSGRSLKVYTDQPGIQFYSGNYLDDSLVGNGGNRYPLRSGLCLEPQVYPDSPNHQGEEGWQSCVLRPGEAYQHLSVYEFSAN